MSDEPQQPPKRTGLRGRLLKRRRKALGLGQVHVARETGLRQPQLSELEAEAYDRLPPGKSTQIQNAMARILAGDSEHWPKDDRQPSCGCESAVVAGGTP